MVWAEAPDLGIGHTKDGKTRGGSVGRFEQSTFQPTIPQPIRRKRRAGGRVVTLSDAGLDLRNEGAMWGTPRNRALFGPEGQDGVSCYFQWSGDMPAWVVYPAGFQMETFG